MLLTNPRGFCAGVDRAIEIVDELLQLHGAPIYVRKEIVHNREVVESFRARGVVFVEEIEEIPDGSLAVFSAHGVSPAVRGAAAERHLRVVDATCPLVSKVHLEALRFERRDCSSSWSATPITMKSKAHSVKSRGWRSSRTSSKRIDRRPGSDPRRRDHADDAEPGRRDGDHRHPQTALPELKQPSRSDICYATQNRQPR